MSDKKEWHNFIGPETVSSHQGRPYIDIGRYARAQWPKVHKWCKARGIAYSWNGNRFNFEYVDDLFYFCDTWMYDDEYSLDDMSEF